LPLPEVPSIASAASPTAPPARDAPTAGAVCVAPTCTLPVEPPAELPPPTWTLPIEFDALFDPLPPTVVGLLTDAVLPAAVADTDGCELTGLDWTVPAEFEELLPPPTCTEPTEFDAVFPPEPATEVGAEALACAGGSVTVADGATLVEPT